MSGSSALRGPDANFWRFLVRAWPDRFAGTAMRAPRPVPSGLAATARLQVASAGSQGSLNPAVALGGARAAMHRAFAITQHPMIHSDPAVANRTPSHAIEASLTADDRRCCSTICRNLRLRMCRLDVEYAHRFMPSLIHEGIIALVRDRPAFAGWASQPIDLGDSMIFRTRVVGPEGIPQVTDREHASHEPQLAVLSVLAHGRGDVATATAIGLAAAHAVLRLPPEQRVLYSYLIGQALSEAARKALEMEPQYEKFFSEAHRKSYDLGRVEGKVEGKAEGKAESVLMVLRRRGIASTDAQQRRIRECTDLATLDRWLDSAVSVASIDELF